jgi:hypothetical protein
MSPPSPPTTSVCALDLHRVAEGECNGVHPRWPGRALECCPHESARLLSRVRFHRRGNGNHCLPEHRSEGNLVKIVPSQLAPGLEYEEDVLRLDAIKLRTPWFGEVKDVPDRFAQFGAHTTLSRVR